MPRTLGRTTWRWGLPAIGLAAIGCVGCCALPLVAAGGVLGGGGFALLGDQCFTPVWILLLAVGVIAAVVWVIRSRSKRRCADAGDCGCTSGSQPTELPTPTMEDRPSAR